MLSWALRLRPVIAVAPELIDPSTVLRSFLHIVSSWSSRPSDLLSGFQQTFPLLNSTSHSRPALCTLAVMFRMLRKSANRFWRLRAELPKCRLQWRTFERSLWGLWRWGRREHIKMSPNKTIVCHLFYTVVSYKFDTNK